MKLLVRNLARHITESELLELFEAYGRVQSCNLVMDEKSGRSKGFGFVEFPNPGEAKAAVKSLNGREIGGMPIRVKKAENKAEKDEQSEGAKPPKKDKYRDKALAAKARVRGERRAKYSKAKPDAEKTSSQPVNKDRTGGKTPKLKTNSAWAKAKPKTHQSDDD